MPLATTVGKIHTTNLSRVQLNPPTPSSAFLGICLFVSLRPSLVMSPSVFFSVHPCIDVGLFIHPSAAEPEHDATHLHANRLAIDKRRSGGCWRRCEWWCGGSRRDATKTNRKSSHQQLGSTAGRSLSPVVHHLQRQQLRWVDWGWF